MRVNSKQKGIRGEREAVKYIKSLGFSDVERTQQYSGNAGDSDVVCRETLPNLFIEVKFGYPTTYANIGRKHFSDWCIKAGEQAIGQHWVVLWKPNREPCWRMSFENDEGCVATVCGDAAITTMLRALNSRPCGETT